MGTSKPSDVHVPTLNRTFLGAGAAAAGGAPFAFVAG